MNPPEKFAGPSKPTEGNEKKILSPEVLQNRISDEASKILNDAYGEEITRTDRLRTAIRNTVVIMDDPYRWERMQVRDDRYNDADILYWSAYIKKYLLAEKNDPGVEKVKNWAPSHISENVRKSMAERAIREVSEERAGLERELMRRIGTSSPPTEEVLTAAVRAFKEDLAKEVSREAPSPKEQTERERCLEQLKRAKLRTDLFIHIVFKGVESYARLYEKDGKKEFIVYTVPKSGTPGKGLGYDFEFYTLDAQGELGEYRRIH